MIDLGSLDSGFNVRPSGINGHGQIVGSASAGSDVHAFVWLPAPAYGLCQGMHDLHELAQPIPPGDDDSLAYDINDAGIVAGTAGTLGPVDDVYAVVWTLNGGVAGLTDLTAEIGVSGTERLAVAYALNDQVPPTVVGDALAEIECPCPPPAAEGQFFVADIGYWVRLNGESSGVFPLDCDDSSSARDINSQTPPDPPTGGGPAVAPPPTQVVGYSHGGIDDCQLITPGGCSDTKDAVVWPPEVVGPAPLVPPEPTYGVEARGTDEQGRVVGWGFTPGTQQDPCRKWAALWKTPGAAPIALGALVPAPQETHAEAVNNLDLAQIVGCSNSILFIEAHDINDEGWIIAFGDAQPGPGAEIHGFLLRPVDHCSADVNWSASMISKPSTAIGARAPIATTSAATALAIRTSIASSGSTTFLQFLRSGVSAPVSVLVAARSRRLRETSTPPFRRWGSRVSTSWASGPKRRSRRRCTLWLRRCTRLSSSRKPG